MIWDLGRSQWLEGTSWPNDSPKHPGWGAIDLIIIHWPGVNGVPVSGDQHKVLEYLQSQQRNYRNDPNRGYNLGYSSAVDWLGRRFQVRGEDCKNAANAPSALNGRSFSIEVLTNLDGHMTPAQDDGVRNLVGQVLSLAPRAEVIGHRDGPKYVTGATATACPGDLIYGRIQAGEFNPSSGGDDDLTEEQDQMLRAIYNAMFVANPADPSTSMVHQATQSLVVQRLWWDNYPNTIVDGPGSMARKLKSLK
ncbi:MAG TPA: peptidoglycan recognition family protein [Actinomycetes bacterium]|nr:peptidoglycan recognition family protein [Actinomycetes bacterium]